MTLTCRVWWPDGTFDAARSDNPRRAEWPPSPARVFAALRAGASGVALDALRWLERQTSPRIHADAHGTDHRSHAGFVVINGVAAKGGNLTHPGRSNGLRERSGTTLAEPTATLVWPDAQPANGIIEVLDKLAINVPYVGRSTSVAVVSFDDRWAGDAYPAWVPAALGRGDVRLPVPYPGFLAELDAAYDDGRHAWETYRDIDYIYVAAAPSDPEPRRTAAVSPYVPPLVLRFRDRPYLPGTAIGALTSALRRAMLARIPDPLPNVISGHGADGKPHAAFLALPDTRHKGADGHLLALAVTGPHDDAIATALGRAIVDDGGMRSLRVPGLGTIELNFDPTLDRPLGATADHWTEPHNVWATVTPMVLDRHPRGRLTAEQIVSDSVVTTGFPRPDYVEVSPTSFVTGGLKLRRHQVPLRDGDRRPTAHARITFGTRVTGPVLIGALRHLGMGLCVQDRRRDQPDRGRGDE